MNDLISFKLSGLPLMYDSVRKNKPISLALWSNFSVYSQRGLAVDFMHLPIVLGLLMDIKYNLIHCVAK